MKLNIGAFTLAVGLFWGGAILLVGVSNLIWPGYGRAFLQLVSSMYPGYTGGATIGQVVIGTLYGLVDGAIGGAVFAWLYNWLSGFFRPAP
ncbi:MAG: hypothetical protein HYY78_17625 [Betaproteobacteria bacterium]|nr:hypothetical protein [Betaproteobacteria bacterium]